MSASLHRPPRTNTIDRLSEAQGHRCCYCGVQMRLPGEPAGRLNSRSERMAFLHRLATRDHLQPKCLGGSDARDNLVAACLWCNNYRSNHPAEIAFSRIQRRLQRGSHPHQVFASTGRWPTKPGALRTIIAPHHGEA